MTVIVRKPTKHKMTIRTIQLPYDAGSQTIESLEDLRNYLSNPRQQRLAIGIYSRQRCEFYIFQELSALSVSGGFTPCGREANSIAMLCHFYTQPGKITQASIDQAAIRNFCSARSY